MSGHVADILRHKSDQVICVDKSTTVYDAIATMVDKHIGAVLVTDGEEICGIFTERDYLRRIALRGRTSKETHIGEVVTTDVVCIGPEASVQDCMAIMTSKRIRHLPVMDGGKVVGIVSIGDCVKQISAEADAEVQYLTDYISGKYSA